MARLDPLIRLRKHELDRKRKALADLERQRDQLAIQKDAFQAEMEHEAAIAAESFEARTAYTHYYPHARRKLDNFQKELDRIEIRIQSARTAVQDGFAELKKIEQIRDQRLADEDQLATEKEIAELDETGLQAYLRSGQDE